MINTNDLYTSLTCVNVLTIILIRYDYLVYKVIYIIYLFI